MKPHSFSEVIFKRKLSVNGTIGVWQQTMQDKGFDRSFIHVLESWLSCIFIEYKWKPPFIRL